MMNEHKYLEHKIGLADTYECTGCMACADICPCDAIIRRIDDDGHCYVCVDYEKCINCGKCTNLCKSIRSGYGINERFLSVAYAAWSNNIEYRTNGTSGGVFASLADWIISRGGVVFCAFFNGLTADHVCIKDKKQIKACQGSRYVQSNTLGVYRSISSMLREREVLFVGLGCQVAAAYRFFENHPKRDQLYLVDIVCAGVPSSLLLKKYCSIHPEIEKITTFRSKRKYQLKGIVNGRETVLNNKPLPLTGFGMGFSNRYSCYDCKFAFLHRNSDMTIGDLWGDIYQKEASEGLSLLIVHSEKGHYIMNNSNIECHIVKWGALLKNNRRVYYGKRPISILRKNLGVYAKKWSDVKFCKVYSLNLKVTDGWWFIYKVYYIFRTFIRKKYLLCSIIAR